MIKIETLVVVYQPPRVLLAMKKVRFGKGKYNGFGGGCKDGESLEQCAIREFAEETGGAKLIDPRLLGKIKFTFLGSDEPDHLVHFYRAPGFEGTLRETEEMKPEWFEEKEIPYEKMWLDDRYWLPILLAGKSFEGWFNFKDGKIDSYKLNEVTEIRI